MSREDEIICLNKLKEALNGGSYIKIETCNCDLKTIRDIFYSATPNPNKSIFPDFIFPNGSLEHFTVTSSRENKDGSSFKETERKNADETEEFFEEQTNTFYEGELNPNSFASASVVHTYEDFSYQFFLHSVKRNFEKHIKSLSKTIKAGDVVFLIEQQDARLGIYRDNIFREFYLIGKDKELLQYFKQYSNVIKYIVFLSVDSVEIIYLPNIDSLIQFAKSSQDIRGGRLISPSIKIMGYL